MSFSKILGEACSVRDANGSSGSPLSPFPSSTGKEKCLPSGKRWMLWSVSPVVTETPVYIYTSAGILSSSGAFLFLMERTASPAPPWWNFDSHPLFPSTLLSPIRTESVSNKFRTIRSMCCALSGQGFHRAFIFWVISLYRSPHGYPPTSFSRSCQDRALLLFIASNT